MVPKFPLPERDFDPSKLEPLQDSQGNPLPVSWTAPRMHQEHVSVMALAGGSQQGYNEALEHMLSKALVEPAVDPLELCSKLTGLRLAGEYLFLARPLLYSKH